MKGRWTLAENHSSEIRIWLLSSTTYFFLLYLVLMHDASTALIRRLRKPPLSMTCKAWIVAPPGEATLSFNCPGCCSDSRSIFAAPLQKKHHCTVNLRHRESSDYQYQKCFRDCHALTSRAWAPSRTASLLGSPIFTPPSARASTARNAWMIYTDIYKEVRGGGTKEATRSTMIV